MKIKLHKNPARKNNVFYKNNEEVHCGRQICHYKSPTHTHTGKHILRLV